MIVEKKEIMRIEIDRQREYQIGGERDMNRSRLPIQDVASMICSDKDGNGFGCRGQFDLNSVSIRDRNFFPPKLAF